MKREHRILRVLEITGLVMFSWLLIWALWLKMNDITMICGNYSWLSQQTLYERFTYDLIPFQLHFDYKQEILNIVANCFVFAPFGVLFNMMFKKRNIMRDLGICFLISLFFELLQLFTMIGNFATMDLITNVAGYFVGLVFYELIFKKVSVKANIYIYLFFNLIALGLTVFSVFRTAETIEPIIQIITRTY